MLEGRWLALLGCPLMLAAVFYRDLRRDVRKVQRVPVDEGGDGGGRPDVR